MSQKVLVQGILVLALVLGLSAVADALVMTDEERLEGFVDQVTSTSERLDATLRYVDTMRVPVELVVGRSSNTYEDDYQLAEEARSALQGFEAQSAELLQDTIEIRGDRALVALRWSTPEGALSTQFRFVRRGDGWVISRLRVL